MDAPQEYTLEEWLADYQWFCRLTEQFGPNSASIRFPDVRKRFDETRQNPPIALYCARRFYAAMAYLEENMSSLNFGKVGVFGSERMLINRKVIVTLYRFFAARPDNAIYEHLPVEDFITEVKSDMDR